MTDDGTPPRSRRWLHTAAVAVVWVWGVLAGAATAVGAVLVLSADSSADGLEALPSVFGTLLVVSGPFGVLVAGLGLWALRPAEGVDGGRGTPVARVVATIAVVLGLVVLIASATGRQGEFSTGLGVVVWFAALWPVVVLPAAVGTLVALATTPARVWVARPVVTSGTTPR